MTTLYHGSHMAVPVVSSFRFEETLAHKDGCRFKVFESYNWEWLDFVVACRQGSGNDTEYDIVEGGVANDNGRRLRKRHHYR